MSRDFDLKDWLEREGKAEGWYGNKECISMQLHDTTRIFIAAHNGYTVGIMDRYSPDANTLFPPFPDFPSALEAARKFIQLYKEVSNGK